MSNKVKKLSPGEEKLKNDMRRTVAARLEEKGDAFLKEGKPEEAADAWFRSWNLRSHLIAKDAKNESWDDFLRISLKYSGICRVLKDTEHMANAAALILNIALRRFEVGSTGMIAAVAVSDEILGQAYLLDGLTEDAAMRYEAAALQYARAGNTAKSDECRKIEAELRKSLFA